MTKARERFKDWGAWVRRMAGEVRDNLLEPRGEASAMIEGPLEEIPGHWKAGLTTALGEGFNSLFSATQRKARGFRSSV